MPRPEYRSRGGFAEVGDFVRGWADAAGTEEVAGVVVSVHPDATYGSTLTLAVLDYDEMPSGYEPDPEGLPPGCLSFKNHANNAIGLTLRTVEGHADRFELVFRRGKREGFRGVLREPDAATLQERRLDAESRRRQMESSSFVPPKGPAPAHSPIVNDPPPPPPKAPEGKDATPPKKDEPHPAHPAHPAHQPPAHEAQPKKDRK